MDDMYTIELRGLQLYGHHGCYDTERAVGCRFELDLDLRVVSDQACVSDDVADAVDYVAAVRVAEEVMAKPHHLLESLANDLRRELLRSLGDKGLRGGVIWLRKLAPKVEAQLDSAGVKMYF